MFHPMHRHLASTPTEDLVGDDGVSAIRHFWPLDLHLTTMGKLLPFLNNIPLLYQFAEKPLISILKPTTSLPHFTNTAQGIYSDWNIIYL